MSCWRIYCGGVSTCPKKADDIMDTTTQIRRSCACLSGRWSRYLQRYGEVGEVSSSLDQVLALDAEDPDIILAAADIAISKKQFSQAEELLHAQEKSGQCGSLSCIGIAGPARGEPDEAVERIQEGLKVVPENQALQLFLADLQLQRNDLEGVRHTLELLDTTGLRHDLVEYLQSRGLLAEGRWLAAMRQLESIRPLLADLPAVVQQIDLMLAQCYEKLGQPDLELAVYRQAPPDPGLVAARIGEMRALTALGRQALAIESLLDLEAV